MKNSILTLSLAAAFAASLCACGAQKLASEAPTLQTVATETAPQAKYIFYYIGDGMGMGPAVAAEMYNRQILNNPTPITMMQFPVAGQALTYSASSPVTDSAAAGTALSAGIKTKNGMLGMNPDTIPVYSIARALEKDGYGIGIITSVSPDDATPGAFYAHVPNRSMPYEIGVQAAESGYAFIGGAGLRGLTDKEGNPTGLLDVFAENNVQVIFGPDSIQYSNNDKLLVLSHWGTNPNEIGYTIDSIPGAMTLPVLTQACLDQMLKVSPDKFFMMVEGGNIDHALHANDGGTAIKETLNFNQALDIAYKFYLEHPDETLIVVTADHDTGGMTVGNKYLGYNAKLGNIDYQRISKETFQQYCYGILQSDEPYTWTDMEKYLQDNLGFWKQIKPTEKQTEMMKQKFEDTFEKRNSEDYKTLYASFNAFAQEVFKVFNDLAGIGFVASSHTGNPVPVYAIGVDAQKFSNLNNNIDIPAKILEIATK